MTAAVWKMPSTIQPETLALAQELKISLLTAQLLTNRGVNTPVAARAFLKPDGSTLIAPEIIPGLEMARDRLAMAVRAGEKILIFGDYDADGLTATAIMLETLERLGIKAGYYLPERFAEGYGISIDALRNIQEKGYTLVVTVDCGITAVEEAVWAQEQGLELIITDHHQPGEDLPSVTALVNPWLAPEPIPLCGAGVAFKLAQSLAKYFSLPQRGGVEAGWALDLAALGTIADAVPLLGENRLLVQLGLKTLAETKRPGLKALAEIAGLPDREWSCREVAFNLIPRLNACGRMGKADPGLELLITSSAQRALELAQQLQRDNQARRLSGERIAAEAEAMASAAVAEGTKGLVLASQDWHPGVIGIVAARLAEKYNRPVVLIALNGESGQGSGRTTPGIDLHQMLEHCRSHLLVYGGHSRAAGLEIRTQNLAAFQAAFNEAVQAAMAEELAAATVLPEAEVLLNQLDWGFLEELNMLAPFGEGNPRPLLLYRRGCLKTARQVGNNKAHLKLSISDGGQKINGIGFNLQLPPRLHPGEFADLAFYLEKNVYQEREELQLIVQAIKPAAKGSSKGQVYEKWMAATGNNMPVSTWCRQLLEGLNSNNPPRGVLFASGIAVSRCYFGLKRFVDLKAFRPLGPWLGKGETKKIRNKAAGLITCSPFQYCSATEENYLASPLICDDQGKGNLLASVSDAWKPISDLAAILNKLLKRNQRVLIYESNSSNIRRLIAWLRGQFPRTSPVLDTFTDFRQMLLVHQAAQSGQLPILIARRALPAWFYPAEAVIFNYLPKNQEELELALPLVEQTPEIYITTKAKSRPVVDLRRELGRFYRWIRHQVKSGQGSYIFNSKNYYQRCYLAILEELDLLQAKKNEKGFAISLLAVSTHRDLTASRRFQQLIAETKLAYKFQHKLQVGGDDCGSEGIGTAN